LRLQTGNHQFGTPADLEAFIGSDLPSAVALTAVAPGYRPDSELAAEQDPLAKV